MIGFGQKKPDITTIGSALLDTMFYTDQGTIIETPEDPRCSKVIAFEQGAKIRSNKVYYTWGGGAANTAVTFARMGLRTRILTAVGNDAMGDECRRYLQGEGVDASLMQTEHRERTGASFIVNVGSRNDHVIFAHRGALESLRLPTLTRQLVGQWLYVSALTGNWHKNLATIQTGVTKYRLNMVWNPGSSQIAAGIKKLKPFLAAVHTLIVNQDEATELLMNAGMSIGKTPAQLARSLYRYGVGRCIVTAGHKGATLYDGKKIYFQAAKLRTVRNKTGAGDAFGSGYTTGCMKGLSLQQSLRLGSLNSSSVIGHIGAQAGILTKSVLQQFTTNGS